MRLCPHALPNINGCDWRGTGRGLYAEQSIELLKKLSYGHSLTSISVPGEHVTVEGLQRVVRSSAARCYERPGPSALVYFETLFGQGIVESLISLGPYDF
jgi:hypothetical protein